MRNYRILALGIAVLALASCGPKAGIDMTVADAAGSKVIVKQLNVNSYDILDTIKVSKSGKASYSIRMEKGQPEFVYVFYKDTKIASLLLEAGEKAVVVADTLGKYTVSGSEGSDKLKEVEEKFSAFASQMLALVAEQDRKGISQSERSDINLEMGRLYVSYYRDCIRYIMQNPKSFTDIPVLYQRLNENAPIFSQPTDAVHFRAVCDSLKAIYPDSRYVKMLEKETERRENILAMGVKLQNSPQIGYLDESLPDINGRKVAISDLKAKVVLVHFWTSADPTHSMFNHDVLLPIYNDYHRKGLEIYSICADPDKAAWALVMNEQKLPWINVNDGLGLNSRVLSEYNVVSLPSSYIISDGSVVSSNVMGETGLRRELARILK